MVLSTTWSAAGTRRGALVGIGATAPAALLAACGVGSQTAGSTGEPAVPPGKLVI